MHEENLIASKIKIEHEKKIAHDIDRIALDNGIRMAEDGMLKRQKEISKQISKIKAAE